jgi:hypothetical protein
LAAAPPPPALTAPVGVAVTVAVAVAVGDADVAPASGRLAAAAPLAPPHITTPSDIATAGSAVTADRRSHRRLQWCTGPVAFCEDPSSNIFCTVTPFEITESEY